MHIKIINIYVFINSNGIYQTIDSFSSAIVLLTLPIFYARIYIYIDIHVYLYIHLYIYIYFVRIVYIFLFIFEHQKYKFCTLDSSKIRNAMTREIHTKKFHFKE